MESFVPTPDGRWVSEKFERLASVIQDYDENLELRWIPPEYRTREDKKPFCIVHKNPQNGAEYTVLYASELDDPEDILARLWIGDTQRNDVLDYLDKREMAAEALRMKERMDIQELQQDFAAWLMKTDKNFINARHPITGEMLKLDSQLRRRDGAPRGRNQKG
jgi:hypothetical protein